MKQLAIVVVAACAAAPPKMVAITKPVPRPIARAEYHDPDHQRGPLPSAEARKAELAVVRTSLVAMYAHRRAKEQRYAIDEDALFREAERELVAAPTWARYDAAIYQALAKFHDGHLTYHPPSTAAPAHGYTGYRLGLTTVLGANDRLLIAMVEAGSDLAAAGVMPGDEVTAIDGEPVPAVLARAVATRAWSRPEAARNDFASTWTSVLYPKGEPPRSRSLGVAARAGGAAKTIAITPQRAGKRVERVAVARDGDVALVAIRSLDPAKGRLDAIDAALATARGSRGIVLDLRGDRGGVDTVGYRIVAGLGEGTLVLGAFRVLLTPETLARRPRWKHLAGTSDADGFSPAEAITTDGLPAGQGFKGPIAVLIDASCASTCETVVAALRADLRAILIGATTAGSSGAPVEVKLPSGAAIAIPTWDLVSAEGRAIESEGVVPDIAIVPTPDALAVDGDPALAAARATLRSHIQP